MTGSVLITGAGGFVGSHLAEGLHALGYAVTGLDRAFDGQTRTRLAGTTLVESGLEPEALNALGHRFDVVIHAAAITTPADTMSDAKFIKVNVDLLLDCLDYAVASGAEKFVFLSSSGVFAETDGGTIQTEDTLPTGTAPYAVAKRAGETIALAAHNAGFSVLVVRLGPVYGPHEIIRDTRSKTSLVRRCIDSLLAGDMLIVETPGLRRDWTFAPDLPRALHALFKNDATGLIHLTSGDAHSNIEIAELLASLVPGASVDASAPIVKSRPPMASSRDDLSDFAWTAVPAGLARTLLAEVVQ